MSEAAENLRMIRDSAAAVVPPGQDLRRIRALRFHGPGFDRAVWRQMAELGWIGLLVPEADGGSGLGMAAFCALAEELGGGLVPEPLVTGAMAARLLSGAALAAQLDGSRLVLPAWQETADAIDIGGATRFRDGRVHGTKRFVALAGAAEGFVVATRDGLALVAADSPGVHVATAGTQDGGHVGTVVFDGAPGSTLPGTPAGAIEEAALGIAATLLGVMERCFALTLDFLRTRQQFGRPIGSFQVLQHRAADLKLQIALARASIGSAAAALDANAPDAAASVSRAKARASDAAMLVTRASIQLHGGIGYTDEYDAGLYLRRAMVLANAFGSPALHRARFAALSPEYDDE